jgi:hypothetical protein
MNKPKEMLSTMSCSHIPSQNPLQIHELYHAFPSQGGFGYQEVCTQCKVWLICSCQKEWLLKNMPNYIKKLSETENGLSFAPNVCDWCLNKDEKHRDNIEKINRVIEYIAKNDREFFNYCYGGPVSGYEKDMNKRYEQGLNQEISDSLRVEIAEAKIRQEKARKLLNEYIYRTKD